MQILNYLRIMINLVHDIVQPLTGDAAEAFKWAWLELEPGSSLASLGPIPVGVVSLAVRSAETMLNQ